MRRVYIAGPMSNRTDFNYPAFYAAEDQWRARGWDVGNPADNSSDSLDLPYRVYIERGILMLLDCDSIALLPEWEQSRGARLEFHLAHLLGYDAFDAITFEPHAPPDFVIP